MTVKKGEKAWSIMALKGLKCILNITYYYFFFRGRAAYLYLISILIWPHFDTYPYISNISIQNIFMRAQNILIIKIYL